MAQSQTDQIYVGADTDRYEVLKAVAHHDGPATPEDLTEQLADKNKTQLSAILGDLWRRSLLDRRKSDRDYRPYEYTVAMEGKAVLEARGDAPDWADEDAEDLAMRRIDMVQEQVDALTEHGPKLMRLEDRLAALEQRVGDEMRHIVGDLEAAEQRIEHVEDDIALGELGRELTEVGSPAADAVRRLESLGFEVTQISARMPLTEYGDEPLDGIEVLWPDDVDEPTE